MLEGKIMHMCVDYIITSLTWKDVFFEEKKSFYDFQSRLIQLKQFHTWILQLSFQITS